MTNHHRVTSIEIYEATSNGISKKQLLSVNLGSTQKIVEENMKASLTIRGEDSLTNVQRIINLFAQPSRYVKFFQFVIADELFFYNLNLMRALVQFQRFLITVGTLKNKPVTVRDRFCLLQTKGE